MGIVNIMWCLSGDAKEENIWSIAPAPWCDISRIGEAQGSGSVGRASDVRSCTYMSEHTAEVRGLRQTFNKIKMDKEKYHVTKNSNNIIASHSNRRASGTRQYSIHESCECSS